ncbi:hypothetical protein HELRODRAFT_177739 [Helobdella robusta]|uniref:WSC domain-containing protein n=1 Tax=Helobdella robusta TaxID=6412 RepID=T1FC61_HELRO|nr:hypothetical protein HELRODRAFT_177739 [Helobdella robusta]ESN97684.1 hypothetical protein HELRODRAFT_177739 [Helobdella robusta]
MAPRKLSLVVFVVLLASYHPTAAIERVNKTILTLRNHKGCYRSVANDNNAIVTIMERNNTGILECYKECSNYIYHGIMDVDKCSCKNSLGTKVGARNCDQLCSDGFPCGGDKFFSFYEKNTIVPVGCFNSIEIDNVSVISTTISSCRDTCYEHLFKYSAFDLRVEVECVHALLSA